VEGGVTEEKEVTQDFELSVRSADAETARNDVKESVAYDDEYGFSGSLTLQDITIGETLQADSTYMATAHYAGTVTRTEAGTVHYTLLYAPVSVPVVAAAAESGITPALLIMGIACALLFIAVLLIITHLLRKEPSHAAGPAKPTTAPKVYVPSGDIVLGGRNEDDDEENL
jgi:ABC-type Na+ efflux pump permease subunit